MFDKMQIFSMANGLATHASARQSVIARNMANADTPGYRAQDITDFATSYRNSHEGMALRQTRGGHLPASDGLPAETRILDANGPEEPNGNSVSLEEEMLKAADVKSKHDLAIAVYRSSLNIMRTSLGRK